MKKDKPDPFSLVDAEAMIAKTRELWGEAQANYEEFRFFTGLRPSEQIALEVSDCDMRNGTVSITKARVDAQDKDHTKTGMDRLVELCPRALDCLTRQLRLRNKLKLAGSIDHEKVFFHPNGKAFHCLQVQWKRWCRTERALTLRHRDPYSARHTSVSWNLMIGKNPLWVAQQHGHSVAVMLDVYAAWTKGAKEADVAAIRDAMNDTPQQLRKAA